MQPELSAGRLAALRCFYLFNAVVIAIGSWPELLHPEKPWDLLHSVAYSIYAGFSLLMLAGVRLPVTMLPMLLLQLLYKSIWLIGVAAPMAAAGLIHQVAKTLEFFAVVALLDLAILPWPYVFAHYIKPVLTLEKKVKSS